MDFFKRWGKVSVRLCPEGGLGVHINDISEVWVLNWWHVECALRLILTAWAVGYEGNFWFWKRLEEGAQPKKTEHPALKPLRPELLQDMVW